MPLVLDGPDEVEALVVALVLVVLVVAVAAGEVVAVFAAVVAAVDELLLAVDSRTDCAALVFVMAEWRSDATTRQVPKPISSHADTLSMTKTSAKPVCLFLGISTLYSAYE